MHLTWRCVATLMFSHMIYNVLIFLMCHTSRTYDKIKAVAVSHKHSRARISVRDSTTGPPSSFENSAEFVECIGHSKSIQPWREYMYTMGCLHYDYFPLAHPVRSNFDTWRQSMIEWYETHYPTTNWLRALLQWAKCCKSDSIWKKNISLEIQQACASVLVCVCLCVCMSRIIFQEHTKIFYAVSNQSNGHISIPLLAGSFVYNTINTHTNKHAHPKA